MNQNSTDQEQERLDALNRQMSGKRKFFIRIAACTVIIILGYFAKMALGALREPPKPADLPPPQIRVDVQAVYPEDVPVVISGYGEVRALDSVALTPKVAGEVTYLHPNLEIGKVIPEGELLYRIDQRDYLAAVAQAQAQVERLEIMVNLLREQYQSDQKRVETVKRTRDIAKEEFDRDMTLYEKQDIGSASMVNLSEINYRKAQDAFEVVEQAISLYPMRIREAEAGLKAARAAKEMAGLSLERTEAFAPFTARIQHKQIEVGQAVAPGVIVLLLANDSVLELSVPIDSRDARRWLPFLEEQEGDTPNWFRPVEPANCLVRWTEDRDAMWNGTLHRVERFDPMTRTVTVAIRVNQDTRQPGHERLPLVEGMFCEVEIPGRTMRSVFRLPRWTVSFDGQVYIAEGNILRRRSVGVVRTQGEETFLEDGLEPGELVVVTRRVDPVPGILLEYELPESKNAAENNGQGEATETADIHS